MDPQLFWRRQPINRLQPINPLRPTNRLPSKLFRITKHIIRPNLLNWRQPINQPGQPIHLQPTNLLLSELSQNTKHTIRPKLLNWPQLFRRRQRTNRLQLGQPINLLKSLFLVQLYFPGPSFSPPEGFPCFQILHSRSS